MALEVVVEVEVAEVALVEGVVEEVVEALVEGVVEEVVVVVALHREGVVVEEEEEEVRNNQVKVKFL